MGGKLANIVREMVTSNALAEASGAKRQQVLIMDECDGMSGMFSSSAGSCVLMVMMQTCICDPWSFYADHVTCLPCIATV